MRKFMMESYLTFFRGGDVNKVWSNTHFRAEAQSEYCKLNNLPHFAPPNGYCCSCKNNIYVKIDMIKASTELITGCPYCHRSYCD